MLSMEYQKNNFLKIAHHFQPKSSTGLEYFNCIHADRSRSWELKRQGPAGGVVLFFSICIIYTFTLERPLVFGVIQKNGILSNEDLFFWRALFFDIYLISWGSLQHSTLDERFTPRLVQKDSKGGSFRKMLPVESWKRRFAPLPVLKILCLQCMQCMRFFTCALQALGWDME